MIVVNRNDWTMVPWYQLVPWYVVIIGVIIPIDV